LNNPDTFPLSVHNDVRSVKEVTSASAGDQGLAHVRNHHEMMDDFAFGKNASGRTD
jgi:hypothetical protein